MGVQFGISTDKMTTGDFDGDRRTDFAVLRPSNGVGYQQKSRDGFGAAQFGAEGDIPMPAALVP
jgi:hypothetical protein